MRKRLVRILIATVIATSMSSVLRCTPVYATPSISEIEDQLEQLDNSIQNNMNKIEEINKEIEAKKAEIDETEKNIVQVKSDLSKAQKAFEERIKIMYISGYTQIGTLQYIETILSSNNFTDMFNRVELVKKIIQYDQKITKELDEKQSELSNKEAKLKEDEKILEKDKDDIDKELEDINNAKLEQQKILAEQQQELSIQPSTAMYMREAIPNGFDFSSDTSESAKNVIEEGEKYLGVPYVWGGTTPNGFDCSGLMQYVYAKYGIALPRVAEDQQRAGIQIPITQMKPGDLIFFGYPAHHVAMYIGNGQYLHAPHTGDVVKISPLNPSSVSSVSRVLL